MYFYSDMIKPHFSRSFFFHLRLFWLCQSTYNNTNFDKWATTWQNKQNGCAHSEDSDQPGHPPSLIRVFAVPMKKAWIFSYPLSAQGRLWSDWANAQADLSLRWAHTHFVGFVVLWLKSALHDLPGKRTRKKTENPHHIWASSRENLPSGFATR